MRFLLWTAAVWALMAVGILTIDIGYVLYTGTSASASVTEQIDFAPDKSGVLGWMGRTSRYLDKMGHRVFGDYTPLAEILIYGILSPLLIAAPIGWEAHRREWSSFLGGVIAGAAGILILSWLVSKPTLTVIYYSLVNALLLSCRVVGLSYYGGSLLFFIFLPLTLIFLYAGYLVFIKWSMILK